MMKKVALGILIAGFLGNASVASLHAAERKHVIENASVEIVHKPTGFGIDIYVMCIPDKQNPAEKKAIGSIAVTYDKIFAQFELVPEASLPAVIMRIKNIAKVIREKYVSKSHSFVLLGDLYVDPAWRGKGLATLLVNHVCKKLNDEGISFIALFPEPFEYVRGVQQSLEGKPEYQEKYDRVVQLYNKLNFVAHHESQAVLFMYRTNALA